MAEGFISDEDVQRVRDANDIVAVIGERVPLRQRGRDFWCCCPFHNEKTPSLKVDSARQLWHCFGCGEGGDIFGFVMKADGCTFPEAVTRLAERAHIDITPVGGVRVSSSQKARLRDICEETAAYYHLQLMRLKTPRAASARSYLASRGFGGDVPARWNLGFAPGSAQLVHHLSTLDFEAEDLIASGVAVEGNDGSLRDRFFDRIIFPIRDANGDCVAFGGRVIDVGEPKYLNSKETPIFHKSQVLYGLDMAKGALASTGVAIVVEGYTDVISLHEHGVTNAVATLGTALTMRHIRTLSQHARKKIVYLFDGDEAGVRAATRALNFIDESMTPEAGKTKVEICAAVLPDGLDPADFLDAHGADELRALVDDAQPLLSFGIERCLSGFDLETPEGRSRAVTEALALLAPIKDSLLAKDYAVRIAARCRMREADVLDRLAALKPPRKYADEADGPGTPAAATATSPSALVEDSASPASQASRDITPAERNRLRFEREALGLLAQHPLYVLEYADQLAQIRWHDTVHALCAKSMLATLSEDPAASSATIVARAADVHPRAAGVLTRAVEGDEASDDAVRSLIEELSLGDYEEEIDGLKARLANPEGLTQDEIDATFNELIAKQKDLAQRRSAQASRT